MTKYNREKHLETLFKQFLFKHFNSRDLWWNYSDLDDDCLRRLDKDLYMQIVDLFPDLLELMGDYK